MRRSLALGMSFALTASLVALVSLRVAAAPVHEGAPASAHAALKKGPVPKSLTVAGVRVRPAAPGNLWADFNGDGYTDIAATVYNEAVVSGGRTLDRAGVLAVFYGGPNGVNGTNGPGAQIFNEDMMTASPGAAAGNEFSRNLGAGDYNCDGYSDVAAGITYQTVDGFPKAGAISVIYGGPNGLQPDAGPGNQYWTEDDIPGSGGAATKDIFGWASLIGTGNGDFNADGSDDLVTSIQGKMVDGQYNAGAWVIIYGGPNGLAVTNGPGAQYFTENDISSADGAEFGDICSRSFAAADFNKDGYPDLAIGCQTESLEYPTGTIDKAGAVIVMYGSANGIDVNAGPGNQFWTADKVSASPGAQTDAWFGRTGLDVGDLNGDGYGDLVIGILLEDVGSVRDAGAVAILYGGPNGLQDNAGPGSQYFTENDFTSSPGAGPDNLFGRFLIVGDFNKDGFDDLCVGIEGQDIPARQIQRTGATACVYGSGHGLDMTAGPGNQFWLEDDLSSVTGGSQTFDQCGRMMAAGDFNNDGYIDMVLGCPGKTVDGHGAAGAFDIVYGGPNGLQADAGPGNQFINEDTPGVPDQAADGNRMARWLAAG